MKIGFDCDGVLADFARSYQRPTIETTGKNLFAPTDETDQPCWDWPQFRGYTDEEMAAVWDKIKASSTFWLSLHPLPGASVLKMLLPDLVRWHDIYYCTSRRNGVDTKWQTELWLQLNVEHALPTVLITSEKGLAAKTLGLDVYVDDNYDNVLDVATHSPTTRTYLLNATYNQGELPNFMPHPITGRMQECHLRRINKLGEMFDAELERL